MFQETHQTGTYEGGNGCVRESYYKKGHASKKRIKKKIDAVKNYVLTYIIELLQNYTNTYLSETAPLSKISAELAHTLIE